jgi:hypothetical protein
MTDAPSLSKMEMRVGRIIDPNTIILLLELDAAAQRDIPHTGIAIWRRAQDWKKLRIDYNGIDVTGFPGRSGPEPSYVIIGNTGKYTAVLDGSAVSGFIVRENALASADVIRGSVMAVGIIGGVYRMKDPHAWEQLSNPLVTANLEAVCEYPSGGFLVCGWDGLVAHYDGAGVEQLESGTNVILTDIICDDGGEIFACGQRGIILRGTKGALRPLNLEGIIEDFWSIAKFQGNVYVSSISALYQLVDDESLELVEFDDEVIPTSFYRLDTYEDSLLLSVGQKDAVLFDGKAWTRIL